MGGVDDFGGWSRAQNTKSSNPIGVQIQNAATKENLVTTISAICGAKNKGKKSATVVMSNVVEENNAKCKGDLVVVGDREVDIMEENNAKCKGDLVVGDREVDTIEETKENEGTTSLLEKDGGLAVEVLTNVGPY